jgi:hypothetical protein
MSPNDPKRTFSTRASHPATLRGGPIRSEVSNQPQQTRLATGSKLPPSARGFNKKGIAVVVRKGAPAQPLTCKRFHRIVLHLRNRPSHRRVAALRRYGRCKMNQAGRSELPSISSPSDCLPRLESARCPKANCPPIGGATKNSRAVFERVTSASGERRSYRKFCAGGTRPKRLDDPACICGLLPSSVCLASALPR